MHQFVKAGNDTPIVLDLIDETLHQMALFVEMIIVARLLAVFAGLNNRFGGL